jgi:hypothetical protein
MLQLPVDRSHIAMAPIATVLHAVLRLQITQDPIAVLQLAFPEMSFPAQPPIKMLESPV